jgi:CPA2 family monovalent cation:H+ antiporter-2
MHTLAFLQDLAVVMIVAGLVTILFHRFKQPVVLGYILAGFIIGPHTPPFSLITGEESINTQADTCHHVWDIRGSFIRRKQAA